MPGTKEGAAKRLAKDDAQKRLEAKFGSKDPVLMEQRYVVGVRPLLWHGFTLQPGESVPDAHEWPRLEAWVRAKRVVPAYGPAMTTAEPPVEAGQPEDLPENAATAAEDDDPRAFTGEAVEEGQ